SRSRSAREARHSDMPPRARCEMERSCRDNRDSEAIEELHKDFRGLRARNGVAAFEDESGHAGKPPFARQLLGGKNLGPELRIVQRSTRLRAVEPLPAAQIHQDIGITKI